MSIRFLPAILPILLCSLASCATNYVTREYAQNRAKLQSCAAYTDEPVPYTFREQVDGERAEEIRTYFARNAGLDLAAVAASQGTTWQKSLEVAAFVARNVPNDNQREWLDERNAVTLWEYSRRVPTGFNCRWHSILLGELLLAAGIRSRLVTCLPEDRTDGDCHVVNEVWLPELGKWAMLDSDMAEIVMDGEGVPLSLAEMRALVASGKELPVRPLPGFERGFSPEYLAAYWAKNLYWFSQHTTIGFDLEGARTLEDTYLSLVPPGYDCSHVTGADAPVTTNAEVFWQGVAVP